MSASPNTPVIPALDGVRGFACLLVLLGHAAQHDFFYRVTGIGQLGVMLFFTLSGFLMAYHYMPGSREWRYWLSFLTRRFFRIYPVFIAALLIVTLIHYTLDIRYFSPFTYERLWTHLALIKGYRYFWTIVVECKFYILFCFLAAGLLFLGKHGKYGIAILCAIWMTTAFFDIDRKTHQSSLLPYLSYFIGGIIAAYAYRYDRQNSRVPDNVWNAVTLICIGIILLSVKPIFKAVPVLEGFYYPSYRYVGGMALLMSVTVLSAARSTGIISYLFGNPTMRYIGFISYSLYLCNRPVFYVLDYYVSIPSIWMAFILNMGVLFIVSWGMYRTIEKPFHTMGKIVAQKWYAPS